MVGLAGFEPAISWVPGAIDRSQATRIVRTHRGYPGPLDLAIRQPLAASKVRCCFSSYSIPNPNHKGELPAIPSNA